MDILVFSAFLSLASVLIVVGVFGPRITLLFSGSLFLLLAFVLANEPVTQSVVVSYNQTNGISSLNNSAFENLTSGLAFQTGTQYSIRQYPQIANYTRTYNYTTQTLMARSWQYGLIVSGFAFGLILFAVVA